MTVMTVQQMRGMEDIRTTSRDLSSAANTMPGRARQRMIKRIMGVMNPYTNNHVDISLLQELKMNPTTMANTMVAKKTSLLTTLRIENDTVFSAIILRDVAACYDQ